MKSTPSLSSRNHFDVLLVDPINDVETETPDVPKIESPPALPPSTTVRRPKWERLLPKELIIAAAEADSTSLKLKVEIETTDTAEKKSVTALVDCGSTGEVIDRHYTKSNRFKLIKLTKPIPVYNVDGTPN